MFCSEDREQNEMDYQYVVALRNALAKAIAVADEWHDDCNGGNAPGLEIERALLKRVLDDDF